MEFDPAEVVALLEHMERNYSLRSRHPERGAVYADYTARSERLRAASAWRAYSYATPERCGIDWFPADGVPPPQGSPLLVFIHGGFWRALDRRIFSFIAEHYMRAGIAVAMLGYELAPAVRLDQIVEQVREAMAWLGQRAATLGFDPRRVVVSGHSAGGHLAALLSAMPPAAVLGQPVLAAVPVSGVFALVPLLLTSVNHDVRMSPQDALRLSPAACPCFHAGAFLVAVGGSETEGFIGQSRDFVRAAVAAGTPAELMVVPQRTHFDVLEDLARPGHALFQQVLRLFGDSTPPRCSSGANA